ncbi:MAG: HAMP domain-containing sensor histidine kinase [Acidobacteriota bacterium]
MRLGPQLIAGHAALVVLTASILLYTVGLVERMAREDREQARRQASAAAVFLDLSRHADELTALTSEEPAAAGPDARRRLVATARAFAERLDEARELELAPEQSSLLGRLEARWSRYVIAVGASGAAADGGFHGAEMRALAALSRDLLETSRQVRLDGLEGTAVLVDRLKAIAWMSIALLVGAAVVLGRSSMRSLARFRDRLLAGLQAVAAGHLQHQIETDRQDELSTVADSFNAMVRRLSDLESTKKDLIANVSHELKSPLAAMRETNELLLDELPGPLNEKQKQILRLNNENGARLSSMISKLLDLSQMEAGGLSLDLQRHDLTGLTRRVMAELDVRRVEKDLRVDLQAPSRPTWLHCDGDRVVQVIDNLLDNAMKHSPRGGAIAMRITASHGLPGDMPARWRQRLARVGSEFVLLSVVDSGPGVPEDQRERIFDKFHQVDGRLKKGGVGLGLAICREIVEAHDGAIWATDLDGRGGVFRLLLPCRPLVTAQEPAPENRGISP